ncbi:MAG TPA: hypothetical protein VJX67_13425 [Blastocatellia bacterium]|nr:hypothetical protein [Blastocatellia bacterium]
MKIGKLALLTALTLGALFHQSDGQAVRPLAEQLKLASIMPRGALVYLQAHDLSALMKTWMASPVRDQFYKSPSFDTFSKSRIYVKLQNREADFEKAIGFSMDEGRLKELAGGASAIAIYDIGKLEIVFVTEMPRTAAVATTLFKGVPRFEERSAGGATYYSHDVSTDGGRLNQQFCFAYSQGRLIVTTTEGLMIRALGNSNATGADSLLADVMATSGQAKGFAAHDLTMWLDQTQLNKSRHFNSYWIYHNSSEQQEHSLANIQTGLIDLRLAADGMHEERWFVLRPDEKGPAAGQPDRTISGEDAAALMRLAPPSVQLIQVHGNTGAGRDLSEDATKGVNADASKGASMEPRDDLGLAVARSLFAKLPSDSETATGASESLGSTDESQGQRTGPYNHLDNRFDVDVDDDGSLGPSPAVRGAKKSQTKQSAAPAEDPEKRFAGIASAMLSPISVGGYCEMVRSSLDPGKPFARFERAVAIAMKGGVSVDRAALERAITDELRARFVVTGVQPVFEWRDEGGVRYVAQSLLDQGAAYAVSGKYLVLASSKELARDILRTASAPAGAAKPGEPVELYSVVRIADAKPVFDKLMNKLDGRTNELETEKTAKTATSAVSKDNDDGDESKEGDDNNQEVKFFSDNISSLIAASAIREMRLRRETTGSVMREQVTYSW